MEAVVSAARRSDRVVVPKEWFTAARRAAGLTQDGLARKLDVALGTVSKREQGLLKGYQEAWLATLAACGLPASWQPPASPQ